MNYYSSELKESMVQKMCLPGGPSALQLSKDTGISQTALSRWKKQFGQPMMSKKKNPEDWSPEKKLRTVFETLSLSKEELGEYLRKNGLHSNQIEEWKDEMTSIISSSNKSRGRPKKDPELVALQNENKHLKRDLRRKEKALAEQTALVVLQKKARELWGDDEDEE